ncbi:MAG: DegT/DnrJ/EryC1/StrS family aminotransferase [Gemmatimonadaceae bacterium]|nr:DegT/DnrJ/EryC1/StrS family aminotransferase [Gemmatimonadaceae bacterium]MDQ3519693.1 DegT/DnrJ/EryC1/StrS family aminotransferase [Gemmatimonadota bacterium]
MSVPLLDLHAQHALIRQDVVSAMLKVVDEQQFILGKSVADLERAVCELSRTRFAIGCASGTDALLLALRALDVGPGDEVITTPFTFFATAGTIHNVGAKAVFADIEPGTFNLDPRHAGAVRTSKTKAVIPVDLFGQMAAIEQFDGSLSGVPIIEDAAQSIGARRKIGDSWVMAGERATIGTFSFFPTKNLGGYGDGGMLVTQDEAVNARLRRLRVHGGATEYYHDEVGYNSRLDTLQAAVLLAKLPHLAGWSAARRLHAARYDEAFADVAEIQTPVVEEASESIFNQYTIRTKRRDLLQAHLKSAGIGSKVYYPLSLHLQPCFAYLGYREGSCPESELASREVLSLPIYPEILPRQQDETIGAIRSFFGR